MAPVVLQDWCRQFDVACPPIPFSMNMIGRASKKHLPCMDGNLKAAHVKVYLCFLADQAYRLCTGTPHSKLRAVCAWGMAHFLHVLDMSPRILPHGKTEEAAHALQAFLDAYQRLAVEATQAGQCLWKVRPQASLHRAPWQISEGIAPESSPHFLLHRRGLRRSCGPVG